MDRSPLSCPRPLGLTLVGLTVAIGGCLAGCGRFGFEALSDRISDPRPAVDPEPNGTVPLEDGGTSEEALPGDAGDDPVADASPSEGRPDAGMMGGPGRPPPDSCMLVADAIACANFNKSDWPANLLPETSDGYLDAAQGYLNAETDATDGYARLRTFFPARFSGTLYLRMSMFIPADADLTLVNFAELVSSNGGGIDFTIQAGELELYSHETVQSFVARGFDLPVEEWFCFRAEVDLGDGDGAVRTFVEDTQLHDQRNMDNLPPEGIEESSFGLSWVGSDQSSAHIIVDDFALASSPLPGCP